MVKNNNLEEIILKLLRDNEKNKEPVKENIEVFDGIIVAEELNITVTATLSEPVLVGAGFVCGTSVCGFFELGG